MLYYTVIQVACWREDASERVYWVETTNPVDNGQGIYGVVYIGPQPHGFSRYSYIRDGRLESPPPVTTRHRVGCKHAICRWDASALAEKRIPSLGWILNVHGWDEWDIHDIREDVA